MRRQVQMNYVMSVFYISSSLEDQSSSLTFNHVLRYVVSSWRQIENELMNKYLWYNLKNWKSTQKKTCIPFISILIIILVLIIW